MRRINYCSIFGGKGGYNQLAKGIVGLMNYMPEIDVCATELHQNPSHEIAHLFTVDIPVVYLECEKCNLDNLLYYMMKNDTSNM